MLKEKKWARDFRENTTPTKIKSLANSLNGKFLLLGFSETLQVLDASNGKTLNHLQTSHKKGILKIIISKYGNYFLTIGIDNKIILWDGSELSPQKKFSLNSKAIDIKFAGFNDNETTAYIITNKEIAIFKVKNNNDEKELKKIKIKDRVIEGAAYIESLGVLITADSLNFISIYDVITLERVNLTQKLNCVNFIKVFDKNKIWIVFSNNSLAVYEIEDTEIKFDVFEKKTPFEILDIKRVNKNLFLAAGFSNTIAVLNGEGHYLMDLLTLENSAIIRRITYHKETSLLTIAEDFYNLISFKIQERPQIYKIDNLWIKIKNLGQLELSFYEEENPGIQGSYKNYTIDIQGYVQSIGYNENSYLAVLSKNNKKQKIRLFESSSILKNIDEFEFDNFEEELDDFEKLLKEKKKSMTIDFFENPEKVFCTITYLIFKLKKSIILTDFQLNILKTWNFNYLINFINVYSCLKRKESAIVCLENGEIIKINFDNPFPVTILDYKLSILFFEFNENREKFLIIDKNFNFNLYQYNPENLSTTQLVTIASISSAGFNKSNPDLFYTLSLDNILTIKYKDKFLTIHNFLNQDTEKIIFFQKTQILIKNLKSNYIRLVEISLNQITSELIKNKNYKETLNLLLSVDSQNQQEFIKLAVSSFSDLSPFAIEAIKYTKDGQLLHLAEEVFKKNKDKSNINLKIEKIKIKAEMMSYEGKFNSAVDMLLSEKQIVETLEMLIVLGKYDRAIKILKNPVYKRNLNSKKYNLNSLIYLQAIEAKNNGEDNLALELFKNIKENEEVVKILIKKKKDQDLINFIRTVELTQSGKKGIKLSINYFKQKNNITYAKECLIKLDEKLELLDLYIEMEIFDKGLILFNKLKNEKIIEPERIFIPYANFLMRENRFEEALENYKKIEKIDLCLKMLEKFISINLFLKNYILVSIFLYESFKLKNSEIIFGLDSYLFLFLDRFLFFKNYISFSENKKFFYLRNIFCLVLNLLNDSNYNLEHDFIDDLNFIIQKSYTEKLYNFTIFFIENLKIMDSKQEYVSKWNFIKNICIKKKNNKIEKKFKNENIDKNEKEKYLYFCYNCENKGFLCPKLTCSECGLKLFFCSFSGKQIPIFEIIFENNIKSELFLSLENYRNFNIKKNLDKNFMKNLLKKNYEYQRNKGILLIDSENIIKRINFENFIEFEENKFFYKFLNEDILICENCGVFYDLDVFEEFSLNDNCLICKKNEFSTY